MKTITINNIKYRIFNNHAVAIDYYGPPSGDLVISDKADGTSVTRIGNRAFSYWFELTGLLIIPASVTKIGDSAFYGCSGFTGTLTISSSVTVIGAYAFAHCGFNKIRIPKSLKFQDTAFKGCKARIERY